MREKVAPNIYYDREKKTYILVAIAEYWSHCSCVSTGFMIKDPTLISSFKFFTSSF